LHGTLHELALLEPLIVVEDFETALEALEYPPFLGLEAL
jgi:hypothetical protein